MSVCIYVCLFRIETKKDKPIRTVIREQIHQEPLEVFVYFVPENRQIYRYVGFTDLFNIIFVQIDQFVST